MLIRALTICSLAVTVSFAPRHVSFAQMPTSSNTATAPLPLPIMDQLKRSVVFLTTNCKVPATDSRVQSRNQQWVGTGFFVFYPDTRLGPQAGFNYLVTNRHVVLPGVENKMPCTVLNYRMTFNVKSVDRAHPSRSETVDVPVGSWSFPEDPSVDLAVGLVKLDRDYMDYKTISTNTFATNKVLNEQVVEEGDHLFFSGLLLQYYPYLNQTKLEPVVRGGLLALIPQEKLPTVMGGLPGNVYLAEAHVFGGNSGSPVFVDVGGNREHSTGAALDYRLLGVVSGEVFETETLSVQVTSSGKANAQANSGLSMIVPAQEILNFLNSKQFQSFRDQVAGAANRPPSTTQ